MKYLYYPGCTLHAAHSTGSEFDFSFRHVCQHLEVELEEVPGWVCCGSTSAHATSRLLALSLPMKNLQLASGRGLDKMLIPCAACFSRFKFALYETGKDEALRKEVLDIIGPPAPENIQVIHPLEIFADEQSLAQLEKKVQRDLSGLKVACYYGCLLARPAKVTQFDECEYPMSMDRILTSIGATVVDWDYKTDCCGAGFSLTETDIVHKLTGDILQNAKDRGADAIAVACSMCHANLDTRQKEIEKLRGRKFDLPIFYFTQLMGLAFGLEPKALALQKHLTSPMKLLSSLSL
jgi:heterodisulfide reductase subunit B